MKTGKQFMLRVDDKFVNRVKKQADRFGTNASAYIRLAVIEKLEKDEGNGKKGSRA